MTSQLLCSSFVAALDDRKIWPLAELFVDVDWSYHSRTMIQVGTTASPSFALRRTSSLGVEEGATLGTNYKKVLLPKYKAY